MQPALPPLIVRRLWQVMAAFGILATALYALFPDTLISVLSFILLGIGSLAACFFGPRRWGAEPRIAWLLMGTAAITFLIGVLIRPTVTEWHMPWPLLADVFSFSGYVLLGIFLAMLLRQRQSVDRHAVLDGLIVTLSVGMTTTLLLALPAAAITDRSAVLSVIQGTYPLFDVMILLLIINLTFTAKTWPFSLVAITVTMLGMFVGDAAYAIVGVSGQIYASPLFNVPFLIAYTALGVAALHPSVVELSRAAKAPVQEWGWQRLTMLAPALLLPSVMLLTNRTRDPEARILVAVIGAAVFGLLLFRATSAVEAQVAAQLRSEHQASHDPLTSLPNRVSISAEIERLVTVVDPEGHDRVWVYMLDLDGFKWVNDSWGHDTGDQLVIEVGRRLRAAVAAGVPVARVGGDEFLLAYVGEKGGALHLVDDIRGCFARPFPVRDTEVVISASIGISHAAGDAARAAVTAEALMRDADTAMYRAKSEGPGRSSIFDTSMHDQVRERIELEVALRQALAEDQLRVHYQPLVRLETGVPVGAEALVRWEHPERGAIPPMTFIPIAEDAGLIGSIGTWVRQEALRQLGVWRSEGVVGEDFYLSINVSPRQLSEPELPLIVSGEMLRYGVPAHCVALEMTESVMVDGSSVTARVLFELRELGVKLLIDDFGTGFSALGYLRRFPVTGVKIDRSFVIGLGANVEDDEIVRAVVAMSHALGLSVIAEGVETPLQREALYAIGVVNGQGWLWGAAVPAAEFAERWHHAAVATPEMPAMAALYGRHRRTE
ncbi:putative diguanylate cyclase/phosphodiesterase [Actinoplanes missouriensis 431]|uniref:Putative diguanylate cyclase/phosphodiesterase n=1 Tax=Actinoplanes missouriensis (strain ATCC 14538 / DSM 43046 / CBS 188.64 / JCM 3121 / NBRC 102363 / NCIMB 12654 / NRRL B-3342 / UNCC 431) TaxID=512565 RepID=I0HCB8_ACTM4|nr:bifunctional diguanylate cyclase/phosphodiesterase [Actinoplanes missouriensis]BAL90655.1 putative diguanylate cyclase/phosphodiesterase [Actinoplanes missouriensis 431]